MDLNKYDTKKKSEVGSWVEIYAPNNEKLDIRIKVLGRDSNLFDSRIMQIADKSRKKKQGLSMPDMKTQSRETYVACTQDWENVKIGKEALECTADNIRKVYMDFPWILDQVVDFVEDRANFL